jgi:hypothetical protein
LPILARHVLRTTPWAVLIAGSLTGTSLLAVLAYVAGTSHWALGPKVVDLAFVPVIAAVAFVPRDPFRPVAQAAPVPAWLTSAGQILLAVPVLAATCWGQLRLMDYTVTRLPRGTITHLPVVYPLLAQLTGWCALAVAVAACCDRSRYADLGGVVAAPVSLAIIALAWYTPVVDSLLATPPVNPRAATIAWYTVTTAALALTCVALRDRWHRYIRTLRRSLLGDSASPTEGRGRCPERQRGPNREEIPGQGLERRSSCNG